MIKKKEEIANDLVILDFREAYIQLLSGRYGSCINNGEKKARLTKVQQINALTLEDC